MGAAVKVGLVLLPSASIAVIALAGCGGGSGSDPASLVPAKAPVYVEATLTPQGTLKANVEALAANVAGIDDIGAKIVTELERGEHASGRKLDYAKDIRPWLGEKGGIFLEGYDGEEFSGYGVAVEATDTEAARAFIDRLARNGAGKPYRTGSYEGVEFAIKPDGGEVIGIVGDWVVYAEDGHSFRAMVDASEGESLADAGSFSSAVSTLPGAGLARLFVDIGGLIEEAGGAIDAEARAFLAAAGIDPEDATAAAGLVPGSEQVEIDFSSDLSGEEPSSGDASGLLGSLPAHSVAAFASTDFGRRFEKAIDRIDARGIPGQVPPHEFKRALKEAGIDLEQVDASIGDVGVFVEGTGKDDLDGALVLSTDDSREARSTVADVGLLLRASGTAGVTAIGGRVSGFSVRGTGLGPRPLIIAARGERIAVAYGLPAAVAALASGPARTLADTPAYGEAVAALGGTPISGFADGPAALRLASDLVPPGEEAFIRAKRYLAKVDYVAIGAGRSGDLATAKMILGVGR
jgi:hypothetical protein